MTCCAGKPVCCIAALLECEAVARFDGLPPCRPRGATSFGRLEDDRRRHKKIKHEHHRTNEEDEELHGNLHECVEQQAEPALCDRFAGQISLHLALVATEVGEGKKATADEAAPKRIAIIQIAFRTDDIQSACSAGQMQSIDK